MRKINILSINISEQKGTPKHPVPSVTLTEKGVEGDAHSGPWNRQVSLLGIESIRKFEKETGRKIGYGEFAENITTEGMELGTCQVLDRFIGEGFELEVTQIGKACHGNSCSIFKEVGSCVMPKEGIFARVVGSGQSAVGRIPETRNPKRKSLRARRSNETRTGAKRSSAEPNLTPGTTLRYQPKIFSARIITLSDRAFRGDYEDLSGPRIQKILEGFFAGYPLAAGTENAPPSPATHPRPSTFVPRPSSLVPRLTSLITLLPDDPGQLRDSVNEAVKEGTDFIFTTGGTGIGPRDFTPDVIRPILDKEIPGIMEMIRLAYGAEKRQALLSRGVAGVAGNSLVFTLPGSVKAVNEYMEEILRSLMHMVYMLHGLDMH